MPKGVEHTHTIDIAREDLIVIPSLMPKGVEHRTLPLYCRGSAQVIPSLMPKGVVIAEYRLDGILGNELANEREAFPVILIAATLDSARAVKAGVDFIAKTPTVDDLLEAIRRTVDPEEFDGKSLRWGFERLSTAAAKVLGGLVAGKGSREIGLDLGISSKTVESHRARINGKTRARDVGELIRMWKAWKALE